MDHKVLQNEHFSVEATEEGGCRYFVRITVKETAAKKGYTKAIKIVNKRISVPGFRKGHAPNQTVISRYSSYVEKEWKEILVGEAYQAAVELTGVYPLNKESISKPKIETLTQEGAVISLSYDHAPVVPQIDFSTLSLPKMEKENIAEGRIDEILEEVRRSYADWEKIEGRCVESGDFVDITIDSLEEDPPKSIVKDRRFEMSDHRLAPWLKKLLLGLQPGAIVQGESEVDPDAEERIKQNFKPIRVRITLHSIQKMILPPVDDELAKKTGLTSLEELRHKIHDNLKKEAEELYTAKKMVALEDALLAAYPFDLPASLVASEKEIRLSKKIESLQAEHVAEMEIKERMPELENEVATTVDQALRLYYINKQIVKQGSIALTNQELNDEIARHFKENPSFYRNETDEQKTRVLVARMASALLQRKAKEYALAQLQTS